MSLPNRTALALTILLASAHTLAAPAHQGPPPMDGDRSLSDKAPGVGYGCTEDVYEPDSRFAPISIEGGSYDNLVLCPNNDDYWSIEAPPGSQVSIHLDFSHAAGDVDMTLHRANNTLLGSSVSATDVEDIDYTSDRGETLLLRVYGFLGVSNRYAMRLEIEDFSPSCPGDAFEGNDSAADAVTLGDSLGQARICQGDVDWYAFELEEGEGFDFGIDYGAELQPLTLDLFRDASGGRPTHLATGERTGSHSEVVSLSEAPASGRYLVRIAAPDAGFNRYGFSTVRFAPGSGTLGGVAGRVTYEAPLRSPPQSDEGDEGDEGDDRAVLETRWLPARRVPVELVRGLDGRVLATVYTDEDGRYELPPVSRAGDGAFIRVSARLQAARYSMQVINSVTDETTYSHRSAPLSTVQVDASGGHHVDFAFSIEGDESAPFNVVDRSLDAFRFIQEHATPKRLDLTVVWERDHRYGRSYFSGSANRIHLNGGAEDPDVYDDSVILHEFGHFFVHNLSHDDSTGGDHDGHRTNPLVAYGEGAATIFALMVQGEPRYLDVSARGGLDQDFEAANMPNSRGTADGTATGLISEYLIVGAIWDMLDSTVEPHDTLSTSEAQIMRVFLEYMPTSRTRDVGLPGADFADFVAGFRTLFPEHIDAVDAILANYAFPFASVDPDVHR